MFGFTVYGSIAQAKKTGKIPFPCNKDRILGGHAVVAVGYNGQHDNQEFCMWHYDPGRSANQEFMGETWGDEGYGWLPYEYVKKEAALDFWSLLSQTWVDTGIFKI